MIAGVLYSQLSHLMEQNPETHCWYLSTEVMDWLSNNSIYITEQEFKTIDDSRQFGILFESNIDFVAFRLRWL